jgi:POT family proton-dependent oligopeptide transporter
MNSPTSPPSDPSANRWPQQIKYIIGNEAVERFSYYGIRSILAGYITAQAVGGIKGGLGYEKDTATEIIHMFTSANYLMPLLGAWFADKIAGRYNTIFYVSMIYCLGNIVLAASGFADGVTAKMAFLCAGLGLIAFGSGGIKPCVSAFMGDQFKPEQSHLLQKAYGAFYWSINFGSFFAFLVIPWIKNKWNFGIAFGVPGILMALATFIFWLGSKYYTRKPTNREVSHAGFFTVFRNAWRHSPSTPWLPLLNISATIGLPVVAMVLMTTLGFQQLIKYGLVRADIYTQGHWMMNAHNWLQQTSQSVFHCDWNLMKLLGWSAFACAVLWYLLVLGFSFTRKTELPEKFLQCAKARHNERDIASARSLSPILFIFAFIPVFWALFDQTNSTWVMQGNQMIPFKIFGFEIGAEEMQSANPAIVMGLVPLMTLLIYPRLGKFASPLRRMSYGMFIAAASYVVVAAIQQRVDAGTHLSVLWQFVPYFVLTTAEVLVSTTGLEFAFREAAPEMKSAIMSFWLLTVTMGDLLVVTVTKLFSSGTTGSDSVSAGRFMQYAGMMFLVAVLFSVAAAFYRYHDKSAAEGK